MPYTGNCQCCQEERRRKHILYHELAVHYPVRGKIDTPQTAMLTTDHRLATVLDWITCFDRQRNKYLSIIVLLMSQN